MAKHPDIKVESVATKLTFRCPYDSNYFCEMKKQCHSCERWADHFYPSNKRDKE